MPKKSLREIHLENTGLVSDKWEFYLDVYEQLFSPYKQDRINLLEIGIQNGGSLNLWNRYFQEVEIIGCDINEKVKSLRFDDSNISVVVGDASSLETREKIFSLIDNFDVIVDDGSHNSRDIISTFQLFFDCLNYGGTYVIEDLHCSYWQEYGGGLFAEESAVNYFKKIIDLINYESWGSNTNPSELLAQPESPTSSFLTLKLISEIHSVSFYNSLCVVKKKSKEHNLLGKRIVTGNLSGVEPSVVAGEYTFSVPNQSENIHSRITASNYHQKLLLQGEQKRLSEQNIVLEKKYEELTLTHSTLKNDYEELILTYSTLKNEYQEQKEQNLFLRNDLDIWKQSRIYKLFKLKEYFRKKLRKL